MATNAQKGSRREIQSPPIVGGPLSAQGLAAVVVTVTVAVTAVFPLGVTEAGEMEHDSDAGSMQDSATAWLNPPSALMLSV
jgi:hypothetical protein